MGGPTRKECDRQRDKVCVDRGVKVQLTSLLEVLRLSGREATQQALVNEALGMLFHKYDKILFGSPGSQLSDPAKSLADVCPTDTQAEDEHAMRKGAIGTQDKVTGVSLHLDEALTLNSLEAANSLLHCGRETPDKSMLLVAHTCHAPLEATP
eukprot:scaffold213724_cov27-Prasinocladus_malaysianus.AAC.1